MIEDPMFATLKKNSEKEQQMSEASCWQSEPACPAAAAAAVEKVPASLPARLLQHLKEGNPLWNPLKRSFLGALPHQVQPETFGPRFCFSKALPLHPKAHLGPVTLTLSPIWGLDLAHYRNHFRPTSGHQGPLDGQI